LDTLNIGDITKLNSLFTDLGETKFDLVTSDGGFDCSADPECQEVISSNLKRAEYESICLNLGVHGNGVLKMFSCCHVTSLQILESAASSFQNVYLTKPAASKARVFNLKGPERRLKIEHPIQSG
jgi:23S rRNA U2552 (ribose-2'-O)-methylase RlmE/FtsJ